MLFGSGADEFEDGVGAGAGGAGVGLDEDATGGFAGSDLDAGGEAAAGEGDGTAEASVSSISRTDQRGNQSRRTTRSRALRVARLALGRRPDVALPLADELLGEVGDLF